MCQLPQGLRRTAQQIAIAWLLVFGLVLDTPGQRPAANREPARKQIEGRIHSLSRDILRVVVSPQEQWLVRVDKSTHVSVTGLARPDVLRPGMVVRFHAFLSQRGQGTEPVQSLEVFTPEEGFGPTLVEEPAEAAPERGEPNQEGRGQNGLGPSGAPDEQAKATRQGEAKPKPAVKRTEHPTEDGSQPDGREADQQESSTEADDRQAPDDQPEPETEKREEKKTTTARPSRAARAAAQRKAGKQPDAKRYFVAGTLRGIDRKGKMLVLVGRTRIQVPLAVDASVHIESNDPRLARPGDKITVDALYQPQQPGRALAREIKVELDFSEQATLSGQEGKRVRSGEVPRDPRQAARQRAEQLKRNRAVPPK